MKTWPFVFVATGLLFLFHGFGFFREDARDAAAFEASSSTNFFLHGGGLDSISQNGSSSTNFQAYPAGGQAIAGTASSTVSFISFKGLINLIFRSFKPSYRQIHYHWRNDDGTEATATSATSGTANTALSSLALSTVKRIRVEISNEGGQDGISAQQFRLEYGAKITTCGAIGTWTDVGAVGGDWDMGASSLTEAGDTTNIAVATGGVTDENNSFLTPNGGQRETTSQTGNLTVYSNNFVELEYAVQAISPASGNYCFRLTNAGSPTNFTFTVYPEATVSAASTLTLTIDAGGTVLFGTLNYGSRATSTTRLKVDTNSATGYTVFVGRDRAITNTTLASNANPGSININDAENGIDVFDGLGANCTDGTGPAVWPGGAGVSTGLGFVLWAANINKETACWGAGTTETHTSNRYAALQASSSASNFLSTSGNSPNPSYASVGWSIEIKQLQQNTDYTGEVIFTATTVP